MTRWTCPQCDREFGRTGQGHTCVPGITVETLLARHPGWVTEVYAAVRARLEPLGPFHEDAVDVGVFLKSDRSFAELRPLVRSARLWLYLPYPVEDPRVVRALPLGAERHAIVVALTEPAQVDDQVGEWLTQAYDDATD